MPIRVFGQYLNAIATSVGTANTVIAANMNPVAGRSLGPPTTQSEIAAMKATAERMLMIPPEGINTSSTTSAANQQQQNGPGNIGNDHSLKEGYS